MGHPGSGEKAVVSTGVGLPPRVVSGRVYAPSVIIDRAARVVPPRYPDREVRRWIGDALGKADEADLLAAYLWVREVSIGRDACAALRTQEEALRRNLGQWEKLRSSTHLRGRTWEFTRAELDAVFGSLIAEVKEDAEFIGGCLQKAIAAFGELSTLPEDDLTDRYRPGRVDSPLNTIVVGDRAHDVVAGRLPQTQSPLRAPSPQLPRISRTRRRSLLLQTPRPPHHVGHGLSRESYTVARRWSGSGHPHQMCAPGRRTRTPTP